MTTGPLRANLVCGSPVPNHDFDFDVRYRQALIERGVYYFPIATKQGSVSFTHRDSDIDATLQAIDDSLAVLREV